MFVKVGLQEADPYEPAVGPGGEGPLHHHALRAHQGEPQHQGQLYIAI